MPPSAFAFIIRNLVPSEYSMGVCRQTWERRLSLRSPGVSKLCCHASSQARGLDHVPHYRCTMPSQMRHSAEGAALAAASEAVAVRSQGFSRTSDVKKRDGTNAATTGRAVMASTGNRDGRSF
ncbi:MAG: hypothetical protein KatS3mg059_1466 [Thermomicrobiales bacterium]|nr:MAG: hypothetical protein KatS3mg059_1466 [Thermomicrobiales bacterium]